MALIDGELGLAISKMNDAFDIHEKHVTAIIEEQEGDKK